MAGVKTLHHNIFTNGICYFRFGFDVKDLKEYAPYLSLLTELISTVDTNRYDKLELSNEILLHAGGINTDLNVYSSRKTEEYQMIWEIGGKALYGEMGHVLALVKDIVTTSHVGEEKRLREVIGEARSGKQVSLQAGGHSTALSRAMSYVRESAYYTEQIRGISYYDFLCDLDDSFDEHKENLIAVLEALMKKIFVKERLMISVTADDEGYTRIESEIDKLLDGLPEHQDWELPQPTWKLPKKIKNEGFKTAGKVQYVARAGRYAEHGISYNGINKVTKTILSYDYLWNEVRVKGGAYGVMCGFGDDGNGYMVSYRDPNLTETNQVYEGVPQYLQSFDAAERDMMKYIIGTVSELDTPLTPRAKGRRSYSAYMTDITEEDVQKEREEVLAADATKVREVAKTVEAVLADGYICALGSEEKIQQAEDLFDTVRVLK